MHYLPDYHAGSLDLVALERRLWVEGADLAPIAALAVDALADAEHDVVDEPTVEDLVGADPELCSALEALIKLASRSREATPAEKEAADVVASALGLHQQGRDGDSIS